VSQLPSFSIDNHLFMTYFERRDATNFWQIIAVKVIHSSKKLFCNVAQICNLVQEFNGLVSKRVDRKISPFYLY
jgi:hypothetical protein